jgi:hypothetical protein
MDQPERVRYFDQQFLRVDDFNAEQTYHRDMRRRHNRMLHTPGIADGLLLVADGTGVRITPGSAIAAGTDDNGGGAEVVLATERRQELSSFAASQDVFVTIAFAQEETRFRDDAGVRGNTRWRENPLIEAFTSDPTATPPSDPAQPLRVLLGRVTRGGTGGKQVVAIDGSGRRLAGAAQSEVSLTPRDPAVTEPDWVRLRWLARGEAELRGSLRIQPGGPTPGNLTVSGSVLAATDLAVTGPARARSLRVDATGSDPPATDVTPAAVSFHVTGAAAGSDPRVVNDAAGRLTLQAATVQVTGRLGIATNAPAQPLHVNGNAQINTAFVGDVGHGAPWAGFSHASAIGTTSYGLLQSSDGRSTLINKRSGGGTIELRVDNSPKLKMDDAGTVELTGDLRARNVYGVGGAIRPAAGNSPNAGVQFPADPGGGAGDEAFIRYYVETPGTETTTFLLGVGNDADDRLELWQAGAQRLSIYNGNVGLGTRSPVYKLDVAGYIGLGGREALRGDDPWLRLNQAGHYASGVHTPYVFAPGSLNVGGANGWGSPGNGNAWVLGSIEAWGAMTIHGDVRLGADDRYVYIGGNQNGIFMQLHDDMWLSDPQNGTIWVRNGANTGWGTFVGIFSNQSSGRHKTGVSPLSVRELDTLLEDAFRTRLVRYRYRGEEDGRERIGVVSEECPEYLLAGDGESVVVMEYAAMLHGALKALTEKVRRLEEAR